MEKFQFSLVQLSLLSRYIEIHAYAKINKNLKLAKDYIDKQSSLLSRYKEIHA